MPRDFIPCVYDERDLYDTRRGVVVRRCAVGGIVPVSYLHTHESAWLMGGDNHLYFIDAELGDDFTLVQHFDVQARLRAPLFTHFYAAMAALE